MRKTFPFADPPHAPARVVELMKSKVRKFIKRERRKSLPDKADYWDFDCKTGASEASAEVCHVAELAGKIDAASAAGWPHLYIEVIARAAVRQRKPSGRRES